MLSSEQDTSSATAASLLTCYALSALDRTINYVGNNTDLSVLNIFTFYTPDTLQT